MAEKLIPTEQFEEAVMKIVEKLIPTEQFEEAVKGIMDDTDEMQYASFVFF